MKDLPAVSIVVPAYNAARTLPELIASLAALDYPANRVERIVVDNGSTDETSAILAAHSGVIRAVKESRRGRSAARNAGIRESRHDIVAFTDADCVIDRQWLGELVVPLEDSSVGIAGGKIRALRPRNAVEEFSDSIHNQDHAINLYRPPYAATANWASRRAVLVEAGGFDPRLTRGEDVDLAYRIVQAGYRLVYCDDAVIYHRNRSNLRGLFQEGFTHGFYAVPVLKKHRWFLRKHGHRSIYPEAYRNLPSNLLRTLAGRADAHTACDAFFHSGKLAGRIAGSLRFGRLEL